MFTVAGYIDGVSYGVSVSGDTPLAGCAAGSRDALRLLRDWEGRELKLSPTGPEIVVDLDKPRDVLAVLQAHTEITEINGTDVPQVHGPGVPGVVH